MFVQALMWEVPEAQWEAGYGGGGEVAVQEWGFQGRRTVGYLRKPGGARAIGEGEGGYVQQQRDEMRERGLEPDGGKEGGVRREFFKRKREMQLTLDE